MGFTKPSVPDIDLDEWRESGRMERIRPMVESWAESGFGTPEAVYILYLLKIGLYVLGAAWVASLTPGIPSLGEVGSWWSEPIVFQKVIVFTILFEVLGLGCGFGPLTMRFLPPLGAFLHWLRPGTIRLPPWPSRVPGTAGTTRTAVDVILYVAVLATAVWALLASGTGDSGALETSTGLIPPSRIVPLLVALAVLGLRDKTVFLAARTEVYGAFLLVFLFQGADAIVGSKLVMLMIWWGAATSKLNRHFPFVVSVMLSNSPVLRSRRLKRRFHRGHPDDIRPSIAAAALAHGGTVFEFVVPAILVFTRGGALTTAAVVGMICFHLLILSSIPMGVPLEWNVFMIYAIGVLFAAHAPLGFGAMDARFGVGVVLAALVAVVAFGNAFPDRASFLVSMRYYAGNWATSMWCLTPSAIEKIETHVVKAATLPLVQVRRLYDQDLTDIIEHKGYAFRAMHSHGRALFGLIPRVAQSSTESDYRPMDGEFVAGSVLGWNFGEGHLHNEQLIAALNERCRFDEGEVRVAVLESQPFLRPYQEYRLIDAATGEFERGRVAVADMVTRQPWSGEIPVEVTGVAGHSVER